MCKGQDASLPFSTDASLRQCALLKKGAVQKEVLGVGGAMPHCSPPPPGESLILSGIKGIQHHLPFFFFDSDPSFILCIPNTLRDLTPLPSSPASCILPSCQLLTTVDFSLFFFSPFLEMLAVWALHYTMQAFSSWGMGFSCGAQTGSRVSVPAVLRLSCRVEPASPALQGGSFTTGPPGKSHLLLTPWTCLTFPP